MAWSELDILNLALNKLNKKAVSSVAGAGVFADSAQRAFDLLYPSIISGMSWRFATTIQQLSVLTETPPIDWWHYVLRLPSDYLAAVRTYPKIDFQIYKDEKIYTNVQDVKLEYRFLPEVTRLPAYFVHYLALRIAAWFADAVCEDAKLSAKLEAEALTQLGQALFTDAQSHPTRAMNNNPIIEVRNDGWGDGYYGSGYGLDR